MCALETALLVRARIAFLRPRFFEADRFAERAKTRNSLNLTGRSDLSGSLTSQIEANRFAEHAKPRNSLNLTGRSDLSGSQIEADRFAERALKLIKLCGGKSGAGRYDCRGGGGCGVVLLVVQ